MQKVSFPGAVRRAAVAFSIGSKGYMVTGGDGFTLYTELWEFDPVSNSWSQKTSFPGAGRWEATACAIGNKGYVGTGLSPSESNDWWEYNPAANSWTQKTNFAGMARAVACAGSVNGKGYLGTGDLGGFNLLNDFWEYDPAADSWTQKTNFGGTARHAVRSFTINDKLYFATGHDYSDQLKDTWEYNPSLDSWNQKASLSGPEREYAVAFSIGKKGYLGTGTNSGSNYKDFYEYDQQLNTWAQKADFGGSARYADIGFSIGCKGYIGCGWNGVSYFSDLWEYTPDVFAVVSQINPVSCNGGNDGSIDLSVTGDYPPLTLNWSDGSITEDRNNLSSGIYDVTITDAFGCTLYQSFTIYQPAAITVFPFIINNASCGTADGKVRITVAGGTAPYTYLWNNGNTNDTLSGVFAGNYSVTVSDLNGCTQTAAIYISNAGGMAVTPDSIKNISCFGDNDGYISVAVSSYTPPLTYQWNSGSTENYIDSLSPSLYIVTVTDALGCITLFNYSVIEPGLLQTGFIYSDMKCDSNGYAMVSVSGGTSPFSYIWNTGETGSAIVNLIPSVYHVTVSDNNGCFTTDSIGIIFNDSVVATLLGPSKICFGDTVTLASTGGTDYLWNDGSSNSTLVIAPEITGNYKVIVTTGICSDSDSISVTVNPLPVAEAGNDVTIFEGETVSLSSTGGIQYLWTTGETAQSINASPVNSTLFFVTVTDNNGCTATDSVNVFVEVCGNIFVPNAFSPNDDDKDDMLFVYGECIILVEFSIFDRWGELVFRTNDITKGWNGLLNGKPMNTGVFVYYLKYRNKFSNEEGYLEGNIHLLR